MKIEIDPGSGFCFGVVRAISKAEELLSAASADSGAVYCLGDIVHNRVEMGRLQDLGLSFVDHAGVEALDGSGLSSVPDVSGVLGSDKNCTLLIRAHGEPPSTYELCKRLGVRLVDATCPVVAKLQRTVREAAAQMELVGGLVIILGKKGHPEVVGLTGQVATFPSASGAGGVVVVESIDDLEALEAGVVGAAGAEVWSRPVYLLSQTTQSLVLFESVKQYILERCPSATIHDTICRQVSNRNPHLADFASRFDVVLFVSGRKSSNGKALYEVCRGVNGATFFVEEAADVQSVWLRGVNSVGICGATSTPKWLMEQVASRVGELAAVNAAGEQ